MSNLPMHKEAISELLKSLALWLATAGSAVGSFILHSLPYLQVGLCVMGFVSGYYSIRVSRRALKKNENSIP